MRFFQKTKPNVLAGIRDLTYLANAYESDKGTLDVALTSWGVKYPTHTCMEYTTTYERYMNEFKDAPVKMMEIGICDNRFPYASCKMWTGFFSNLELYSVDNFWNNTLDDKMGDVEFLNQMGVNFIYADQGSFSDWEEIKKVVPHDLDFLVEDGSHWPNHMMVSLYQATDLIKSGGYYFMEDIQNPFRSRGMYRYDNSLVGEELINAYFSGKFNSGFLNDNMNVKVRSSFELVDLILDPNEINYLAVFRKK